MSARTTLTNYNELNCLEYGTLKVDKCVIDQCFKHYLIRFHMN
jgi:hypothetical protein